MINVGKLQQMTYLDPIVEQKNLKVYEQPDIEKTYISLVDVSAGLGQDFSIVNIIDVSTTPYKQVLVYRNNEIDPSSFSIIVENLSKKVLPQGSYGEVFSHNLCYSLRRPCFSMFQTYTKIRKGFAVEIP